MQPWIQPLEQLLRELSQRYGGEILRPKDLTRSDYTADGLGTGLLYPVYHGKMNGIKFHVEIIRDHQLHVHAYGHMPAEFEVYPTGLIEHLQTFLGIDGSVKSGDRIFDRHFTTDTNARDDAGFLKRPEVHRLIASLAPFTYIKIHPGGVARIGDIYSENDIAAVQVEGIISKLVELVILTTKQ
jgi:hypothetical protein